MKPDEAPALMEELKKSRRREQPGDLFRFRLAGHGYFYGRVIRTDATIGGFSGALLVYVYRDRSADGGLLEAASLPVKSVDDLLIAPQAINALGWRRGFFETIANVPLEIDHVLESHCFYSKSRDSYFDEYGGLIEPTEGCGSWGLGNYNVVEAEVTRALGIPRRRES